MSEINPVKNSSVEILIAEDSPTQAEQLKYLLETHGYKVTAASNGKLALAAIRAHAPTLVISDIVMPEMDGYELCRQVKADAALKAVPVILVTTLADPQDVIRGLECGADNFVVKPYDEEFLISRVQFVLLNRDIRQEDKIGNAVEILFNGQRHQITADRMQILNLLLSTYEAAIQRNLELARAKDELRASNDAFAEMNKELEAFSFSVSHDLRTPVNAIKGYAQILIDDRGTSLDAEVAEIVRKIGLAGARMQTLIESLLSLAKLGRTEIKRASVDLSAMANEIVTHLQLDHPERRVVFTVQNGLRAMGDANLLRVVMENLLSNAWKYTAKREDVSIEIGKTSGASPAFFVHDNGVGFDAANAKHLFAPFQRFHSSADFSGTGVGLATVQRIVQRHGGRIWVESSPGTGATFLFTLASEAKPAQPLRAAG